MTKDEGLLICPAMTTCLGCPHYEPHSERWGCDSGCGDDTRACVPATTWHAMTKDDALAAVEAIREVADDPEVAHGKEVELCRDFVAFVAQRNDELGEIARVILSSDDIEIAWRRSG